MATEIVIGSMDGSARLSWPRLARLEADERRPGSVPTVSTTVLLDKSDSESVEAVRRAVAEATQARWGAQPPRGLRDPLRDGDESDRPEQHGCWVLSCRSRQMVPVVDRSRSRVDGGDAEQVYGGADARVVVRAYAYDASGNRGVALGLQAVQVLGTGERFGGGGDPLRLLGGAPEAPSGMDLL